jgi:hypothetical protein
VEEYRVDRTLSAEAERAREHLILESFCSSVAQYNSMESLESAVKHFVWETFGRGDFNIVNSSKTDMKGQSQNSVFFVNDIYDCLRYVVKAFPDPCSHPSEYLAEISALSMIEKLDLSWIAPIKPLGYAIYRNVHQCWGLLLETVAQGKRIDEYLHPLMNLVHNVSHKGAGCKNPSVMSRSSGILLRICPRRQPSHMELFARPTCCPCDERGPLMNMMEWNFLKDAAIKAFSRMGQSLAQLHGYKEAVVGSMPEWNLERYNNRVMEMLGNDLIRQQLSETIPVPAFVDYVTHVKNEVLAISVPRTYLHGDAHFGNMFYSEEEELFYFIDAARLHKSIDRKGLPILDGTLDLLRVEENLKIFVLKGLSEGVANLLLETFYQSYREQSGRFPEARLLNFYRVFMLMGRLIIYSRYSNEAEPAQKKAIFESAIKELATQMTVPY